MVKVRIIRDGTFPNFHDSYDITVMSSDLFLFIAGVFLGLLIFLLFLPKLLTNVFITPKLKGNTDINMVSVLHEKTGKEFIYLNPRTFTQSVGMLISFVFWRFSPRKHKKTYHLHVNRTATLLFYVVIFILSVNIISALYLIFTIQH